MRRATVVLGTRGSELALWQTNWVTERLAGLYPDLSWRVETIKTTGDKMLDVPLARIGGKGLFTKELETALLDRRIDIAVHSLKDLPTELPAGLEVMAITAREDPRDVLLSSREITLAGLPPGARLGTSSLRRKAQLWHWRPDLELVDLRGNLTTRWKKMRELELDGIILAAAGALRLGWEERIRDYLPYEICLPAVGQGALVIEGRARDGEIAGLLQPLHHEGTARVTAAERAFLAGLGGGCQVPIGALAEEDGRGQIRLRGVIADLEGREFLRAENRGPAEAAGEIGRQLAATLIAQGAGRILARIASMTAVVGGGKA